MYLRIYSMILMSEGGYGVSIVPLGDFGIFGRFLAERRFSSQKTEPQLISVHLFYATE